MNEDKDLELANNIITYVLLGIAVYGLYLVIKHNDPLLELKGLGIMAVTFLVAASRKLESIKEKIN